MLNDNETVLGAILVLDKIYFALFYALFPRLFLFAKSYFSRKTCETAIKFEPNKLRRVFWLIFCLSPVMFWFFNICNMSPTKLPISV